MPTNHDETLQERYQREALQLELIYIPEGEPLIDVDEVAWQNILDDRGGCRCFISAPCGACTNPVTEDELNKEGYTQVKPNQQKGCAA